MKAVILAAGEGVRLRPFTEMRPKAMLPVGNIPILHHIIEVLQKTTIDEIIIVIGYQKNRILQYLHEYPKLQLQFIEQEKQLGTAHALFQAKKQLSDDFLVIFGDNLIDCESLQRMIDLKESHGILITSHDHPSNYGVVEIKDKLVSTIIEKPIKEEKKFIATGVYKFNYDIFEYIEQKIDTGSFGMTSVIQSLLDDNISIGTQKTMAWKDVVYPWDLLYVNEFYASSLTSNIGGIVEKKVYIKGPVVIGENSRISSGCYLVGPLIIGNDCEIGPNTCIFPSTIIGDNCVINPFTSIRNSVLMDDCRIGTHSYIARSIIAERVNIDHHATLSENDALVYIKDEIKKVRNVGVMIGEDTHIGNQVSIDSGIIIGKNCKIGSLKHITKNISSMSHVI